MSNKIRYCFKILKFSVCCLCLWTKKKSTPMHLCRKFRAPWFFKSILQLSIWKNVYYSVRQLCTLDSHSWICGQQTHLSLSYSVEFPREATIDQLPICPSPDPSPSFDLYARDYTHIAICLSLRAPLCLSLFPPHKLFNASFICSITHQTAKQSCRLL